VSTKVTLAIDPRGIGEGQTTGNVATQLGKLGGQMLAWTPEAGDAPALAQFRFKNQARAVLFANEAIALPGVSLAAP